MTLETPRVRAADAARAVARTALTAEERRAELIARRHASVVVARSAEQAGDPC